ncbi:MAG: GTPase HflX [Vicinamibacterales bacterium]
MNMRGTATPEQSRERAALVRLATRSSRAVDPDILLDELTGLARAAGAEVVLNIVQDRPKPDSATLIGKGKAETLARGCEEAEVSVVIVDNELSPAQTRNLEAICGRRVVDRTLLILDIFARRARTREGQLQVELAQLQYLLPRLAGSGTALSQQGGGIGTRGPGETKLETDRRRIRSRIAALKADIAEVRRRRGYLRTRRRRADVPTVALVGYTNAGKTTLFNRLTGAAALESDALFATLDPLMRRIKLADARQLIVADTVGFIDRLPHQLVAAFHATLEEVVNADLLLHVMDASAVDRERRAEAVSSVLGEIGADQVPVLEVFNKIDAVEDDELSSLRAAHPEAVFVSALEDLGRSDLLTAVSARLALDCERLHLSFNSSLQADRDLLADLYRHGTVLVQEPGTGDQVSLEADVPRRLLGRFSRVRVPA